MSSPLARYHQATQSWPAAVLLFQIAYWMPKAKLRVGPQLWVAKSAAEWCEDTGLTSKQYKDAVAVLRHKGLVVTARHFFGGRLITHLRLTDEGNVLTVPGGTNGGGIKVPGGTDAPVPKVPKGTDGQSLEGPSTTGITTENYKVHENQHCVLAHAAPAEPETKEDDSGDDMKETYPVMKVKDAHAQALAKLHQPQTHLALEGIWKEVYAEVYGGFVPGFTMKQRGQLKHFRTKCPDGQAALVLEFCLRNWLAFIKTAEADAGAFKTPAYPEVNFLLKFAGIAINLWLKSTKPKPAAVPQVPSVQLIAKPPPEPEDPKPATVEEMLKIFYGEEEGQL